MGLRRATSGTIWLPLDQKAPCRREHVCEVAAEHASGALQGVEEGVQVAHLCMGVGHSECVPREASGPNPTETCCPVCLSSPTPTPLPSHLGVAHAQHLAEVERQVGVVQHSGKRRQQLGCGTEGTVGA